MRLFTTLAILALFTATFTITEPAISAEMNADYEKGSRALMKKDYDKAFRLIHKAAKDGHPPSQNLLGGLYFEGLGTEKDEDKALNWIRKAAKQGEADAQTALGTFYVTGTILEKVEKDEKKAMHWFRKAAKQGDAEAQYILSVKYHEYALQWALLAAEQGHKQAPAHAKKLKAGLTRAQIKEAKGAAKEMMMMHKGH